VTEEAGVEAGSRKARFGDHHRHPLMQGGDAPGPEARKDDPVELRRRDGVLDDLQRLVMSPTSTPRT
jgi:hypothetical protein